MSATIFWKPDSGGGKAKGALVEQQNSFEIVGLSRKQLLGLWLAAMFLGAGLFGIGCWLGSWIKPKQIINEQNASKAINFNKSFAQGSKKIIPKKLKLLPSKKTPPVAASTAHENEYENEDAYVNYSLSNLETEDTGPTEEEKPTPHFIVIGIYKHKDHAKELAIRVKAFGRMAKIKEENNTYLVYLGPYENRMHAKSELQALTSMTPISGSIMDSLPSSEGKI